MVEEAEAERTLFHSQRNKKIEATKAAHRAASRAGADGGVVGVNVWDKALHLLDGGDAPKPKADLSKFKALLVKLKHTPVAPPVTAA